jgi:hypothetical protein
MTAIEIDWTSVPTTQLEKMLAAGREVMECHRVLTATGDNIVGELIKGAGSFYEWSHYPEGDVYDRQSHAQFYYHAHPKESVVNGMNMVISIPSCVRAACLTIANPKK